MPAFVQPKNVVYIVAYLTLNVLSKTYGSSIAAFFHYLVLPTGLVCDEVLVYLVILILNFCFIHLPLCVS